MHESASVVLNASGNGTAKVGPLSSREVWSPANVHVGVTTNVNEATCSIFVGLNASPNEFRDTTFSGSTGDSSDRVDADEVHCGSYILAVWTGGDPGSQATLNVTGTKEV
jgi:hypothetical protein